MLSLLLWPLRWLLVGALAQPPQFIYPTIFIVSHEVFSMVVAGVLMTAIGVVAILDVTSRMRPFDDE